MSNSYIRFARSKRHGTKRAAHLGAHCWTRSRHAWWNSTKISTITMWTDMAIGWRTIWRVRRCAIWSIDWSNEIIYYYYLSLIFTSLLALLNIDCHRTNRRPRSTSRTPERCWKCSPIWDCIATRFHSRTPRTTNTTPIGERGASVKSTHLPAIWCLSCTSECCIIMLSVNNVQSSCFAKTAAPPVPISSCCTRSAPSACPAVPSTRTCAACRCSGPCSANRSIIATLTRCAPWRLRRTNRRQRIGHGMSCKSCSGLCTFVYIFI